MEQLGREKCALCGRDATGYARGTKGERYCHGNQDATPTCYTRALWGAMRDREDAALALAAQRFVQSRLDDVLLSALREGDKVPSGVRFWMNPADVSAEDFEQDVRDAVRVAREFGLSCEEF